MSDSKIFNEAARLPLEKRAGYLHDACGNNAELRREVEALLCAHEAPDGPLLEPAQSLLATVGYEPIAERPGTHIGPYKLLQEIGEGGMGLVFMAEQDEPVRRQVALKVIKPGMDSRQVVARFEAERQALSMMDHPNIAKVLDAGTTSSGRPYFVMELVHGVPITQYCDENRLTPRERLELFIPVCHAIQHAHQKGIIHRDVKPSNVLVTMYDDRPVPKVIDFGVAKAVEQRLTEKTLFTRYGNFVGTFEYMSPEQAELNAFGVDTRSDVYSLGVLLYELLTGTTPLDKQRLRSAALAEMIRIIKEEEPPRPSIRLSTSAALPRTAEARRTEPARLAALVRSELDWIVMRCLEKDRTRRYETVSGLAKDIERYLRDDPVEACPPKLGYRLQKTFRRYRTSIAIAAGFVALASGAAVAGTLLAIDARDSAHVALAERSRAEQQRAEADGQRLVAERERARAEAAERQAREEAAAAKAVRDFLTDDLLSQASMSRQAELTYLSGQQFSVRHNPTINELLDRAAAQLTPEKIESRFPDLPFVQAELLRAVGEAYFGIGRDEDAIKFLTRAIAGYRAVGRSGSPPEISARLYLGMANDWAGNTEEAMKLLVAARDASRASLGRFHHLTILAEDAIGNGYERRGEMAEAIKLYTELRDALVAKLKAHDPYVALARYRLGITLTKAGRGAEAIPELEAVRAAGQERVSPDHPYRQLADLALARAYSASGRTAEAFPLYEAALSQLEARYGTNARETWLPRHQLALAYRGEGRREDAIRLFEQNLLAAPGDVTTLFELGQSHLWAGHPELAEDRFKEAIDQLEGGDTSGDRGWKMGKAKVLHGTALLKQKRYAEAEPLLLDGQKMMVEYDSQKPSYEDGGSLAMAKRSIDALYRATGRNDEIENRAAVE